MTILIFFFLETINYICSSIHLKKQTLFQIIRFERSVIMKPWDRWFFLPDYVVQHSNSFWFRKRYEHWKLSFIHHFVLSAIHILSFTVYDYIPGHLDGAIFLPGFATESGFIQAIWSYQNNFLHLYIDLSNTCTFQA